MAQTPSVGIRVLGALAGLVAGAVLGIIILIAFLLFARPDFGLNDVLIGGVIGEYIGLVIGYCYPERAGRMLGRMIEGI